MRWILTAGLLDKPEDTSDAQDEEPVAPLGSLIQANHLAQLPRLEWLDLNQQRHLSTEDLETVFSQLHRLRWVDVSWIQAVGDSVVDMLVSRNGDLESLHAFGCHRVTDYCKQIWRRDRPSLRMAGLHVDTLDTFDSQ
jgi:hypothetical protein